MHTTLQGMAYEGSANSVAWRWPSKRPRVTCALMVEEDLIENSSADTGNSYDFPSTASWKATQPLRCPAFC